jgi:hypothetical protein
LQEFPLPQRVNRGPAAAAEPRPPIDQQADNFPYNNDIDMISTNDFPRVPFAGFGALPAWPGGDLYNNEQAPPPRQRHPPEDEDLWQGFVDFDDEFEFERARPIQNIRTGAAHGQNRNPLNQAEAVIPRTLANQNDE